MTAIPLFFDPSLCNAPHGAPTSKRSSTQVSSHARAEHPSSSSDLIHPSPPSQPVPQSNSPWYISPAVQPPSTPPPPSPLLNPPFSHQNALPPPPPPRPTESPVAAAARARNQPPIPPTSASLHKKKRKSAKLGIYSQARQRKRRVMMSSWRPGNIFAGMTLGRF